MEERLKEMEERKRNELGILQVQMEKQRESTAMVNRFNIL